MACSEGPQRPDPYERYARMCWPDRNTWAWETDYGNHRNPTRKAPTPPSKTAAATDNMLVLVSIRSSDIEVGGDRGREALEQPKNVVQRKAAQWQPAAAARMVRDRAAEAVRPDSS